MDDEDFLEYHTDPSEIYDFFGKRVDLVIDGGWGNQIPSTVVDCTGHEIEVIRQGLGELEF